MTLKVICFKEYVYICISLHSSWTEKYLKRKRPTDFATGCSFEALYLIKIQTHTVFPNITELLTFAYQK